MKDIYESVTIILWVFIATIIFYCVYNKEYALAFVCLTPALFVYVVSKCFYYFGTQSGRTMLSYKIYKIKQMFKK